MFRTENTKDISFFTERMADKDITGFHFDALRLPARFQKREDGPCYGNHQGRMFCADCGVDLKRGEPPPSPPKDAVEEKISDILEFIRKGERGGEYMRPELRALVALARKA